MTSVKLLFAVALLLPAYLHVGAAAKRYGITVAPDDLGLPAYQTPGLFRRKATPTCSFGRCGNDCLDQGAFCCNPAGPDKPDPNCECLPEHRALVSIWLIDHQGYVIMEFVSLAYEVQVALSTVMSEQASGYIPCRGDVGRETHASSRSPDNPSGTTQSCIDNIPTTACRSTDKCYTWYEDLCPRHRNMSDARIKLDRCPLLSLGDIR